MPDKNINTSFYSQTVNWSIWANGDQYGPYLSQNKKLALIHQTSTANNGRKLRPMSPYYLNKERWEMSPGNYHRYNYPYNFDEYTTGVVYQIYPDEPYIAASAQAAELKALSQLKSGGANLSVMAAEGAKTIAMITDRLNQIRRFANWARNGTKYYRGMKHRKSKGRTEDEVQNLWLELQYGWLPLMKDLDGLLSALAGNIAHTVVRAQGRSFDRSDINQNLKPWPYETGQGVQFKGEKTEYHQCILYAELDSAKAATAAALGLTNPLEVVWELIPFSFVADWFLPIGNTLAALDATSGYVFKGGCLSTVRKTKWTIDVSSVCKHPDGYSYDTRDMSGDYERVMFNRSIYSGFPRVPPPVFKNPLSVLHCVNALELLVQTFRNKLR